MYKDWACIYFAVEGIDAHAEGIDSKLVISVRA